MGALLTLPSPHLRHVQRVPLKEMIKDSLLCGTEEVRRGWVLPAEMVQNLVRHPLGNVNLQLREHLRCEEAVRNGSKLLLQERNTASAVAEAPKLLCLHPELEVIVDVLDTGVLCKGAKWEKREPRVSIGNKAALRQTLYLEP